MRIAMLSRAAVIAFATAVTAIAATQSTPAAAVPAKASLVVCDPSPDSCSYNK